MLRENSLIVQQIFNFSLLTPISIPFRIPKVIKALLRIIYSTIGVEVHTHSCLTPSIQNQLPLLANLSHFLLKDSIVFFFFLFGLFQVEMHAMSHEMLVMIVIIFVFVNGLHFGIWDLTESLESCLTLHVSYVYKKLLDVCICMFTFIFNMHFYLFDITSDLIFKFFKKVVFTRKEQCLVFQFQCGSL